MDFNVGDKVRVCGSLEFRTREVDLTLVPTGKIQEIKWGMVKVRFTDNRIEWVHEKGLEKL